MKYIFKIIWHCAMKPLLTVVFSLWHYGLLVTFFLGAFLWSFSINEALKATKIVWMAQDELERDAEQYWYYNTPFDAMYGKKKWTKRQFEHFF